MGLDSKSSSSSEKNTRYFNACIAVLVALIGAVAVIIASFISSGKIEIPALPTSTNTSQPTNTSSVTPTATPTPTIPYRRELCGDSAYKVEFYDEGGFKKTNLIFEFPNGYTEGFFTSDPGIVEFSDGQVKDFDTQFTLITSGFSIIKINGVTARQEPSNSGIWVPNSYGCIFFPQDAHIAESKARDDYQIYVDANIKAVLYRVTPNGFELLASN